MRFWDSSAILPLLVRQAQTGRAHEVLEQDADIVAWWATPVECASALARMARDGEVSLAEEQKALAELKQLSEVWYEIPPSDEIRNQSRRLLRTHVLRAADAMQLAAAIVWAGQMDEHYFVSYDKNLRDAAMREGFI